MINLHDLQKEQHAWQNKNFPGWQSWECLVGMMEELGELSHAHLKEHQQIRENENHIENARDAVGDIAIFLMGYCNARGWDLESIIFQTWAQVKLRQWQK